MKDRAKINVIQEVYMKIFIYEERGNENSAFFFNLNIDLYECMLLRDKYNDLEMLVVKEYSVAMKNAVSKVKKIYRYENGTLEYLLEDCSLDADKVKEEF